MINVHIADDHAMIIELLIPVINQSGIARVTGFSHTLSECRKTLNTSRPDILLLDINMTDGNGIVFCAGIHKLYPRMKIIALTSHDEYSSVTQMLKNGASGYVTKSEAVNDVLEAIHTVMNGETYISPQMQQVIRKTTRIAVHLTPREKEVLQMVATGMSNPQIAGQLKVALSTILTFRKKLNLKLKATNPVELIAQARREGLI